MSELIKIFINSIFGENIVFIQMLALAPLLSMTENSKKVVASGCTTTFVILVSAIVSWPLSAFVLSQFDLAFLQVLCFSLVIVLFSVLADLFFRSKFSDAYENAGDLVFFIVTNCAVLAILLSLAEKNYGFAESIAYALGTSLGFLGSLFVMMSVKDRLKSSSVPNFLQGKPILFVAASFISLAFLGFRGLVK